MRGLSSSTGPSLTRSTWPLFTLRGRQRRQAALGSSGGALVSSNCPQCGAPLDVNPESEMVTCRFCGNRSFTERRRPPTAQVQQQPTPQAQQVTPQSTPTWFWACIGAMCLIPFISFGFIFVGSAISRPSRPAPVVVPETPRVSAPQSAPATIPTTSAASAKPTDEPAKAVAGPRAAAVAKPENAPSPAVADPRAAAVAKPVNAPSSEPTGPFDRSAADDAIDNVNLKPCKTPDGPVGFGHITIVFAPNGTVSSAVVDVAQFAHSFPGTPVGNCVAGKYRNAHVAPFSGNPVTIGKTFFVE